MFQKFAVSFSWFLVLFLCKTTIASKLYPIMCGPLYRWYVAILFDQDTCYQSFFLVFKKISYISGSEYLELVNKWSLFIRECVCTVKCVDMMICGLMSRYRYGVSCLWLLWWVKSVAYLSELLSSQSGCITSLLVPYAFSYAEVLFPAIDHQTNSCPISYTSESFTTKSLPSTENVFHFVDLEVH